MALNLLLKAHVYFIDEEMTADGNECQKNCKL